MVSAPPAAPASPASVDPNPWAPPITVVPGVPVAQPPSEPVRAPFDAEDDDGATIITNPGAAAVDEEYEATVIARRRVTWSLETEAGDHIALTGSTALLGRNPEPSGEDDAAQLVKLIDPGKTVSKTHARIDLGGDTWTITDLHSTNGVTLTTEDGAEHEVEANVPTPLSERFQLGDFVLRISQSK
jgi:hypothetical protein